LSADAETLRAALDQAAAQPDIRQDVVQRMKEMLDRGEVGNDPHKLADALIDGWLSTPPGQR
jgi:anti-sigma28 factor (negative regulator of flagellin synthesis)